VEFTRTDKRVAPGAQMSLMAVGPRQRLKLDALNEADPLK
jgi:hypothetical protein